MRDGDSAILIISRIVTRLQSDGLLKVPSFFLRPESIGDKVDGALGMSDIDFPEHPVFSKKYYLQGQDEAGIRTFFTPEIIPFFEREPGWSAEVSGDRLLTYRERHHPKPEDIPSFLSDQRRVLSLLDRELLGN